jgi:glycine/D-amino acid oxidase-like deaminating enzyme
MALALIQLSTETVDGAKCAVDTDQGTDMGKKVVLATNGFTPAPHPSLGSTPSFQPGRSQAAAIRSAADTSNNTVFRRG